MSASHDIRFIRCRHASALYAFVKAQAELKAAMAEFGAFMQENAPRTFRLQEAYRNDDGTYTEPHWDAVANYTSHNLVDLEEVNLHILREGEWTEMFHNAEDDPRPGYRRVIEVTW